MADYGLRISNAGGAKVLDIHSRTIRPLKKWMLHTEIDTPDSNATVFTLDFSELVIPAGTQLRAVGGVLCWGYPSFYPYAPHNGNEFPGGLTGSPQFEWRNNEGEVISSSRDEPNAFFLECVVDEVAKTVTATPKVKSASWGGYSTAAVSRTLHRMYVVLFSGGPL